VAPRAPGVVAEVRSSGIGWSGVRGLADIERQLPLTANARFRIGSVTKVFVAALVLQLVAEGELKLDAPAGDHLPQVDPDSALTVRRLLNHTSGLGDYTEDASVLEPYRYNRDHVWKPQALVARAPASRYRPGARWVHSNTNFVLLGLLVEAVTGSSVADELRSRIFEPLRLRSTELPADTTMRSPHARGYMPGENPLFPSRDALTDVTDLHPSWAWTAGGIVSTAGDVARFLAALLEGELLSPRLLAQMLETVVADGSECDRYGLGICCTSTLFGVGSSCGPGWGHLGLTPGYTTIALSRRDGSRQAVFMVNQLGLDEAASTALSRAVWTAFCG
jgi:D-alanyl-D-alanine carboxypeptidase